MNSAFYIFSTCVYSGRCGLIGTKRPSGILPISRRASLTLLCRTENRLNIFIRTSGNCSTSQNIARGSIVGQHVVNIIFFIIIVSSAIAVSRCTRISCPFSMCLFVPIVNFHVLRNKGALYLFIFFFVTTFYYF